MKIKCKICNVDLTGDLMPLIDKNVLNEQDGCNFIPEGYYFISDGNYYTGTTNKILINLKDLKNSTHQLDWGRLNGCCGLDGLDGLNRICTNGHEIATEKSDCYIAHVIIFENELITKE